MSLSVTDMAEIVLGTRAQRHVISQRHDGERLSDASNSSNFASLSASLLRFALVELS
jgi:hypothetical protein